MEPGRTFTPEETSILGQFAQLASVALDNARLHMAAQSGLTCSPDADKRVQEICTALYAKRNEQFGNAREMRNLFEASVRNQSGRLAASTNCDREALTTLLPEDLPADFGTTIPAPPSSQPFTKSRIQTKPG